MSNFTKLVGMASCYELQKLTSESSGQCSQAPQKHAQALKYHSGSADDDELPVQQAQAQVHLPKTVFVQQVPTSARAALHEAM